MRLVTKSPSALFAVLLALSPVGAGPAHAQLVLNEIMAGPARDWDGSGAFSSRDDEWIEVRNAGTVTLDIGSYFLTDGDSIPRLALTGTLVPGARLLLFGKDSYDWERANGFPAFGFSLSNSGDQVMLWQIVAGDTVLVDTYAYRSHEAAADRSIGRLLDEGEWQLFDALNPYTGATPPQGNQCDPSPGQPNACGATPAPPMTWGHVKALYR